jgi:hypothetical protein
MFNVIFYWLPIDADPGGTDLFSFESGCCLLLPGPKPGPLLELILLPNATCLF